MPSRLRLAYFAHTVRSDWNNGNAHFLRGLLRAMNAMGHDVTVFEPETEWSVENLRQEEAGARSLDEFARVYSDLRITTYVAEESSQTWRERLRLIDVVIVHEWNPPELVKTLLRVREESSYRLLFHDTHHRASSSPEQMERFGVAQCDGVIAFGNAQRRIYRERFGVARVWTLHEAADTTVFYPRPKTAPQTDIVWIGNWGEGERAKEIREFLLRPAAELREKARFSVHGVRYPEEGLAALDEAGVSYGGYLPNLEAPAAYAAARLTVHIPRQQYSLAMTGIPTIRVFEALASGIPLISAPWEDEEQLFDPGDFKMVRDGAEMVAAMRELLSEPDAAARQVECGLRTIRARHTCAHRAIELTGICEELLQ